jgi:hypothetical protein
MIILIIWSIINFFIGIWEIYIFINRKLLKLESKTLWEKIDDDQITFTNFWIEGWSEYCKVDSRYISYQYIWGFELLNAILAILFIPALFYKSISLIKIILLISILNCLLYFISLAIEYIYNRLDLRYAKWWQFPIYYMISAIWLIIPGYLLVCNRLMK